MVYKPTVGSPTINVTVYAHFGGSPRNQGLAFHNGS